MANYGFHVPRITKAAVKPPAKQSAGGMFHVKSPKSTPEGEGFDPAKAALRPSAGKKNPLMQKRGGLAIANEPANRVHTGIGRGFRT